VKLSVELDLSKEDVDRLRTSLGSNVDVERIAGAILEAGAREFLAQATGRAVPGGIREARLYRIFLLIRAGVSLREAQTVVAATFKETPGRARGMVEAAIARYDVELRGPVDARVTEVLEDAAWVDSRWEVELPGGFVRDRVLEIASDTTHADPERAGRGIIYKFPDETYQAVRAELGLSPRPKPKA
jgi:hypothetical protein